MAHYWCYIVPQGQPIIIDRSGNFRGLSAVFKLRAVKGAYVHCALLAGGAAMVIESDLVYMATATR